jgi:ketosteroid isomerase-like protein
MSRENVERVRQAYDEFNETGAPPEKFVHADAEFDASRVLADVGVIRGWPAYMAALQDYWSSYDDYKAEVEEILDAEERLVVSIRDSGRPKGSPSLVTNRYFHVVTLRDGKLLRLDIYLDKAQALEAVGLSE